MKSNEFEEILTEDKPAKSPSDKDWTGYVLSFLTNDELKNGNPTVDGLRRVCEQVLGEIKETRIEILERPVLSNYKESGCIAQCLLRIEKFCGSQIIVEAAVDVRYENTEAPYRDFLVATADSRAEAKALRRALKLNVISAEEVFDEKDKETVNDQQLLIIDRICQRNDINVEKFIKQYGKITLTDLSNALARQVIKDLDNLQRDQTKITKTIKGYTKK